MAEVRKTVGVTADISRERADSMKEEIRRFDGSNKNLLIDEEYRAWLE